MSGRPTRAASVFLHLSGGLLASALAGSAAAQDGLYLPGDTIVTGFSGAAPAVPPFPSGDALDETFIDLNGASMRIQRLQATAGPAGQVIPSPIVFVAPARTVGQVFAITLDDAPVPNIYLAASSAYGLEIVAPDADADGRPERLRNGQPGAQWMDGQWGAGGSPGSIYRVDGVTGAITLFTSIGANAGPGLGDIVFDRGSRQFFVSDLDTGMIYRLSAAGFIADIYDHGVTGRTAVGLPPVADSGVVMSIASPAFSTDNPATWGYTQRERRVWGMTVFGGRLYYAVGDGPSVWSVGIGLDGSFLPDTRWEFDATELISDHPITDMLFDAAGRLIVAQRGDQRDAYDYTEFAEPLDSSVARYSREIPDDPATPSTWHLVPEDYAIGFRPDGYNAAGGVALGYDHDTTGRLIDGTCNTFLWATGESLRDNPALAATLAPGGPATVHGLQGQFHAFVRPANDPPFQSYFTDFDASFVDPERQGHLGDVEIWQPCPGSTGIFVPPLIPPPTFEPPPINTIDLQLEKVAREEICVDSGLGPVCEYTVRITNAGTLPYWGPLTVKDWLPANPPGAIMDFDPSPPWACFPTGPSDYHCHYPPVLLWPGDSVDLDVEVLLPPDTELCSLINAARLVWPPGFSDSNPANDFGAAVATVPGVDCPPPSGDTTNLILEKHSDALCADFGPDWACFYQVFIQNEPGGGTYNGDIVFEDTLSHGALLVTSPDFTCVGGPANYTCTQAGASLAPGDVTGVFMAAIIPKAVAEADGLCFLENEASITVAPGGSPQNTNPADDSDNAFATIPAEHCEPPEGSSDLVMLKEGFGCTVAAEGWLCSFAIAVANAGPGNYFGGLTVRDTLSHPALAPSPFFSQPICGPDGGDYVCTSPGPIGLLAGTVTPPLWIDVLVPDDGSVCELTNTAQIEAPPGGTVFNFSPVNDMASDTINVPSQLCPPVAPIEDDDRRIASPPVCPIERQMPGGECCPEGQNWNGQSCGDPQAGDPAEPPPPTPRPRPQIDRCPAGTTGTPPNCERAECPAGQIGTPPDCRQPPAQQPQPQTPQQQPQPQPQPQPQRCPDGSIGIPPNCLKLECPTGTTGTFPDCQRVRPVRPTPNVQGQTTAPQGQTTVPQTQQTPQIQTGPQQQLPACPKGTIRLGPFCVPTN